MYGHTCKPTIHPGCSRDSCLCKPAATALMKEMGGTTWRDLLQGARHHQDQGRFDVMIRCYHAARDLAPRSAFERGTPLIDDAHMYGHKCGGGPGWSRVKYKVTYFLEGDDTEHHFFIEPYERTDGAIQKHVSIDGLGSTILQKKGALKGRNWIDSFTTTPTFQRHGTGDHTRCTRMQAAQAAAMKPTAKQRQNDARALSRMLGVRGGG